MAVMVYTTINRLSLHTHFAWNYDIVITTFNCFEYFEWNDCENTIFMWVCCFYHIG